jgi:hypothetical protein
MKVLISESKLVLREVSGNVRQFLRGLLRLRRGPWEMVATILIASGIVMMMQPFAMWAFTYSFVVILSGTVLFLIVSHFPE